MANAFFIGLLLSYHMWVNSIVKIAPNAKTSKD